MGALKLEYPPDTMEFRSRDFLKEMNIISSHTVVQKELHQNSGLIRQLQSKFNLAEANKLLRDSLYGYYWKITFVKPENINISIGSNSGERTVQGNGSITFEFSTGGQLLSFNRNISDSLKITGLSENQAKVLADNFLRKYLPRMNLIDSVSGLENSLTGNTDLINLKFSSLTKTERKNRTDYNLNYKAVEPVTGDNINVTVSVAGSIISSYNYDYEIPEIYSKDSSNQLRSFGVIIFIIVIVVLMLISLFKRIRAYEIGFGIAKWVAIVFGLSFVAKLVIQSNNLLSDWEILIPLVFGALFLGGIGLVGWAISETIVRENWKEKIITLDLFTKGYFSHSKLGDSILKGLAFGSLGAAFWLILLSLAETIFHIQIVPKREDALYLFSTFSPALSLVDDVILSYSLLIITGFLYVIPLLRKYIKQNFLLIICGGIILGIVLPNEISPGYTGMLIGIIFGIYLAAVFYKTDFITILLAAIIFPIIVSGYSLFATGNSFYSASGYVLISIFVLLLVYGIWAFITKDRQVDLEAIVPAFAKNITERERMQRELEIARDVQMSFLPRRAPGFSGLDIASECEPALEVGGDYYDFVRINEDELGIIIGDVSGKGTQAAFYMTLTKGFLKAVSKTSNSPSEILTLMNELFYENVERGTFISMVYGVFNIKEKKFKIARAGHNPVIMRSTVNGATEFISSKGLALGLEKGILFSRTISEVELEIKGNDTFVFYTDGFTEAMNNKKEEFGEDRLKKVVEENSSESSKKILDTIFSEVKAFRGRAHQTDDMTIVVVKVL